MAETMILALEGRYEHFSLGRDISLKQVDEMAQLAAKHGFRPAADRTIRQNRSRTSSGSRLVGEVE
jgi:hypothetical protein